MQLKEHTTQLPSMGAEHLSLTGSFSRHCDLKYAA